MKVIIMLLDVEVNSENWNAKNMLIIHTYCVVFITNKNDLSRLYSIIVIEN